MRHTACLALAALLVVHFGASCVADRVLLLDAAQQPYLNNGKELELSHGDLVTALSSLAGLTPPSHVDATASSKVSQVLKPGSFFQRPKAVAVLNVAGVQDLLLSNDQLLEALGGGGRLHQLVSLLPGGGAAAGDAQQPSGTAEELVLALDSMFAANPDADSLVLDHSSLKGCHQGCLEAHLVSAVSVMEGTTYSPSSDQPLAGVLQLPGGRLDLGRKADRLFGLEVASLYAALAARADDAKELKSTQVVETTFTGVQALVDAYGADSSEVKAAAAAVLVLLRHVVAELDAQSDGRVVYAVGLLGRASVPGPPAESASGLMSWKESARRSLLDKKNVPDPYDPVADQLAAKKWSAKAAALCSFLVILYFTFAGIYCLLTMKFKQDSLLYPRTKAD